MRVLVAALHGATDDGEGRGRSGRGCRRGNGLPRRRRRRRMGRMGGFVEGHPRDPASAAVGARRAVALVALVAPPRLGLGLILGLVVVVGGRGGVDRFSRGPTGDLTQARPLGVVNRACVIPRDGGFVCRRVAVLAGFPRGVGVGQRTARRVTARDCLDGRRGGVAVGSLRRRGVELCGARVERRELGRRAGRRGRIIVQRRRRRRFIFPHRAVRDGVAEDLDAALVAMEPLRGRRRRRRRRGGHARDGGGGRRRRARLRVSPRLERYDTRALLRGSVSSETIRAGGERARHAWSGVKSFGVSPIGACASKAPEEHRADRALHLATRRKEGWGAPRDGEGTGRPAATTASSASPPTDARPERGVDEKMEEARDSAPPMEEEAPRDAPDAPDAPDPTARAAPHARLRRPRRRGEDSGDTRAG